MVLSHASFRPGVGGGVLAVVALRGGGGWRVEERRYSLNFVRSRLADAGEGGKRVEDMATRAATTKATEVKKPKTFWTRTSEECIFFFGL